MTDANPTPDTPPSPTPRGMWAIPIALLGIVALGWVWQSRPAAEPPKPLPVLGAVPAFSLTDAKGEVRTREDFHDSVWIADFIFTECGGQCADMTAQMRNLSTALAEDGNVRFVSISVDPDDTPHQLHKYAHRHGADIDRWTFLMGPREAVHALANEGFKLGASEATEEERAAGADVFLHSQRFVLVDTQARIRGYYHALDADDLRQLLSDTRTLARGPAAS